MLELHETHAPVVGAVSHGLAFTVDGNALQLRVVAQLRGKRKWIMAENVLCYDCLVK